jgi:predicted DsbA family dithiol-disulfide isomerase
MEAQVHQQPTHLASQAGINIQFQQLMGKIQPLMAL